MNAPMDVLREIAEPLKQAQDLARELASLLGGPLSAASSIKLRRRARTLRDELDFVRTRVRNAVLKPGGAA